MKRARRCAARLRRVYLIVLLLSTALAPEAGAQVELSVTPSMVQGPRDAPVTIVEFSDYQ